MIRVASNTIEIDSIVAPGRLPDSFSRLENLNKLEFPLQGNVVVYAPNGSGKSTIANALCGTFDQSVHCEGTVFGCQFSSSEDNSEFLLIKDQEGRNMAELPEGRALLLGDNVAREMELDQLLTNGAQLMKKTLRNEFARIGLTSKSSALAANLKMIDGDLGNAIEYTFATKMSRDNFFDFLDHVYHEWHFDNPFKDTGIIKGHQTRKCLAGKDSGNAYKIITSEKNEAASKQIIGAGNLPLLEKEVELLSQFKPEGLVCPMCDAKWKGWSETLSNLLRKTTRIKESLGDKQQKIIDSLSQSHPGLYKAYSGCLEKGDSTLLSQELEIIQQDLYDTVRFIKYSIAAVVQSSEYPKLWEEYKQIRGKVGFDDAMEDIELIKGVASSYLGKQLSIHISSGNNLKIELSDTELPSHPQEFPLSTGEKNFLSLLLDLIQAKRSNATCIVIDDPVSSFDSIYKNRIAFLLLDILKDKKTLVLTHSLELVRLLHEQHRDCFSLYMLAMSDNGPQGFQRVNKDEMDLLLYVDKLPKLLSDHSKLGIENSESFLISLVPYIRTWANLTNKKDAYEQCCAIMHYKSKNTSLVELSSLYQKVFNAKTTDICETYVSSTTLVAKELNTLPRSLVNKECYPLLNQTLIHNFVFYLLRLKVECALLNYAPGASLPLKPKLYDYINACLTDASDKAERIWRQKILSKKTLLNSFSHYEWNVNVFQPAIDISEKTLEVEIQEVLIMVDEISRASPKY